LKSNKVLRLILAAVFCVVCIGGVAPVAHSASATTPSLPPTAPSPWRFEPVVKETHLFNFEQEQDDEWRIYTAGWGGNGLSPANVGFTRHPLALNSLGSDGGGVVMLTANGHYVDQPGRRGEGGCIISTRMFGPGKYEVRMRVAPRLGACSTAWTLFSTSNSENTNTSNNNEYHEIDIEAPAADRNGGHGFNAWGGVAYEEYYNDINDNNRLINRSRGVTAHTPTPYNDGQWHTFGFEWRTQGYAGVQPANPGAPDGAVIWYMNGEEVARTAQHTPYYPGQFWLASWFPLAPPHMPAYANSNMEYWLGIPDFEQAYMFIDWIKITEYDDPYKTHHRSDMDPDWSSNSSIRPGQEIQANIYGSVPFRGNATNLMNNVPINNYISNGNFSLSSDGFMPASSHFERGRNPGEPWDNPDFANAPTDAVGWNVYEGGTAARNGNSLRVQSASRAFQEISAQYNGYAFTVTADGRIVSGSGEAKIYAEYWRAVYPPAWRPQGSTEPWRGGNSNRWATDWVLVGTSLDQGEMLVINSGVSSTQTFEFTIPQLMWPLTHYLNNPNYINNVRIVIETDNGTVVDITRLVMNLTSDLT
jgi:hypothetical protein